MAWDAVEEAMQLSLLHDVTGSKHAMCELGQLTGCAMSQKQSQTTAVLPAALVWLVAQPPSYLKAAMVASALAGLPPGLWRVGEW